MAHSTRHLRKLRAKHVDSLGKGATIRPFGQEGGCIMIVGYFRKIDGGEEAAPTAVLRAERCLRIESDEVGRATARRQLIGSLSNGDVLVSPSIAHLAPSVSEVLRVCRQVHGRGATLRLVLEKIDTSIPAARNALNAFAEFDNRLTTERRNAGLYEAALSGARPGRPRKLDPARITLIAGELANGRTAASIARELRVHPTTVTRLARLAAAGEDGLD
jgi:DNA invertase Pin-like site-specific DNA recombinase